MEENGNMTHSNKVFMFIALYNIFFFCSLHETHTRIKDITVVVAGQVYKLEVIFEWVIIRLLNGRFDLLMRSDLFPVSTL